MRDEGDALRCLARDSGQAKDPYQHPGSRGLYAMQTRVCEERVANILGEKSAHNLAMSFSLSWTGETVLTRAAASFPKQLLRMPVCTQSTDSISHKGKQAVLEDSGGRSTSVFIAASMPQRVHVWTYWSLTSRWVGTTCGGVHQLTADRRDGKRRTGSFSIHVDNSQPLCRRHAG